jgi:transcriptional regulator PpsR
VKAFRAPRISLGHLDAEAAAGLVIASADIALVLDEDGAIRDVGFGNDELARDLDVAQSWVGRAWIDTVANESRTKVQALLGGTQQDGEPRWRHVNHLSREGSVFPILCSVSPLGQSGRHVVFGRDLRPLSQLQQRLVEVQQSMERDYSRLRQAETRYRLLFQMSGDPLLVLDAESLRVLEANPAAQRLFAGSARRLQGRPLPEVVLADDRPALLATLRSTGRTNRITLTPEASQITTSPSRYMRVSVMTMATNSDSVSRLGNCPSVTNPSISTTS